ncbi:hypothetical protein [Leptospira yasudae]|uniref:DUF1564 domain-containing protein n=1 Tax=Leptospira yasudae TaxID=2202201 RepID=A0ABX9LZL2_9LEPT|nr:hypothetical protein [Leptospira yasudae]RHX78480.1 hypothetical protein DLM77_15360 [Leptospira yasudae]
MATLVRRFIKLNRYDFYYSRVQCIAENLNGKHNFSEREVTLNKSWVPWSYASNKAIQNFSNLLSRFEPELSETILINFSWKERFYYIANRFRRDSVKITKQRLINRIVESLNNFSFSNEFSIPKTSLFSYSAYLESSKLNATNREENKQNVDKQKLLNWSKSVKGNYNNINFKILMNPNPYRHLSTWDHCFHRSEISLKPLFEDSWQKSFKRCWHSIERNSKYWDKRLQSANEIPSS